MTSDAYWYNDPWHRVLYLGPILPTVRHRTAFGFTSPPRKHSRLTRYQRKWHRKLSGNLALAKRLAELNERERVYYSSIGV